MASNIDGLRERYKGADSNSKDYINREREREQRDDDYFDKRMEYLEVQA